ncbi:ankyrin repeat protein [Jimgerdemannia flammicorona]|uniref:Ankyrin repeat protein n=1 Tax=Jimgerdemannia flammicorona TaxID=994334 RepID=A0A433A151_9FUNG|nr:ankyrin repeat protein [Jimgerdemannia flammicorona]
MHCAAFNGHKDTLLEIAGVSGTDVNMRDEDGRTPLHLAAEGGHTETVEMLVSIFNAEINAKDQKFFTPLSLAQMKGHKKVVKVLKQHGGVGRSVLDMLRP